ncbi:MAG: hypothetical protein H6739_31390 [Alphaproteobacteria bacterium]|nr:hypothetical protein [Alphaproteobacteria bacterium]
MLRSSREAHLGYGHQLSSDLALGALDPLIEHHRQTSTDPFWYDGGRVWGRMVSTGCAMWEMQQGANLMWTGGEALVSVPVTGPAGQGAAARSRVTFEVPDTSAPRGR